MFRLIPLCVKYSMRFGWHKLVEPITSICDWLGDTVQMKKVFPLYPKTLKKHYKNTIALCAILLFDCLKGFV